MTASPPRGHAPAEAALAGGPAPAVGPAALWRSALPWLAGYALLRVLLSLVRLPDSPTE